MVWSSFRSSLARSGIRSNSRPCRGFTRPLLLDGSSGWPAVLLGDEGAGSGGGHAVSPRSPCFWFLNRAGVAPINGGRCCRTIRWSSTFGSFASGRSGCSIRPPTSWTRGPSSHPRPIWSRGSSVARQGGGTPRDEQVGHHAALALDRDGAARFALVCVLDELIGCRAYLD